MNDAFKYGSLVVGLALATSVLLASAAMAAAPGPLSPSSIPGPADASRLNNPDLQMPAPAPPDIGVELPKAVPSMPIPEGAKAIHFTLKEIQLEGATAFTSAQLADLYAPYLGREITLDLAYTIAGEITERYRHAGYFLSLAYVPNQHIHDGVVTIRVVEGYVAKVELTGSQADSWILQDYIATLSALKPATSDAVESFLLRINDMPGYSYRAVLSSLEGGEEGAVKLTLTPTEKDGHGTVTFDNYSSRYLGPHELAGSYSTSLLPLQQTTVSGLTSLPMDRLNYGTLTHSILVAPDLTFEFTAGHTRAHPGYTLDPYDINSDSANMGISLGYQWIRQRQENLSLKLTLDGRDSTSELEGADLSRDHIRTVRMSASYDTADRWRGYDSATFTLTQGIDGLGASEKGDRDLSRAGALPDFTKAEATLSRLQALTENWALQLATSGQLASGTLYSSEQFGYGGQAFGRAFDESEIVGDSGIAASLELQYGGWKDITPQVTWQPYAFIDTGQVWNDGVGQPPHETGSSTGLGIRFATEWNQSGSLGLAFPIDRNIAAPLYGTSDNGPRILLRVSQEF